MKLRIKLKFVLLLILVSNNGLMFSQASTYVDDLGVFRWLGSDEEIRLFGVNYCLPFAHGFRAINYIGKDHKKAIDKDVYHMARLGLDAFRIHIWDSEITDSDGNLITNKHLDLLDYTMFKMKERGIKTVVTPFKVGGNGYPEKNQEAPGFSNNLSKPETYVGEAVLKKQERYFTQILNHVNPYTGISYKNNPDIIGLEINNEPQHDNPEIAKNYINRMVKAIRKAGFKNPIFYNVSERSQFIDAYCETGIQGCTFQWYPTGLVSNRTLTGNFLPNVDKYNIPFRDNPNFKNKARIIYEFDPGDTSQSYIYPAMARSFREAKFQFAAQFAYEPLDLAYANTEYQTHYMNLAYTPSKAISFLIASEVFRSMNNGESYGRYPDNLSFGNTTLNPVKDLAVYNTKTKFLYTNTNKIEPKEIKTLEHIAGVGDSEVVKYKGTGAYFLDKLDKGLWRLEVMPDALWVRDPYEKASLKKTVAIVKWNTQLMTINLPDLGSSFNVSPLNEANAYVAKSEDGSFSVQPGAYLITNKEHGKTTLKEKMGNLFIKEFVAPKENVERTYVIHKPLKTIEIGEDLMIQAKVVSPNKIEKVEVIVPVGYQKVDKFKMEKTATFSYATKIPNTRILGGAFKYYVVVTTDGGQKSFPNDIEGSPEDWDFVSKAKYETRVVPNNWIVPLFDALDKDQNIIWPSQWNGPKYSVNNITSKFLSDRFLNITVQDLNFKRSDMTFKIMVDDKVKTSQVLLAKVDTLVVVGNSGSKTKQKVQIAFQLNNASVLGKIVELNNSEDTIVINFQDLKKVPQVLLPRPFPGFQPYWFESKEQDVFDPKKIEAIQISIGPGIPEDEKAASQHLEIEKIYLK